MSTGGGASLADGLTLASATAVLLGALYGGSRRSARVWKRTVGSRRSTRRKLDAMACGVTLGYVEGRLGRAEFRRSRSDCVELTWRLRHAWFCGLVRDDSLMTFAITVTDKKFSYDCRHLTFGLLPVTLGRDTLAVSPEPKDTTFAVGARRFHVTDEHYFGNPGAYQHYLLAYNDEGVGTMVVGTAPTGTAALPPEPDPARTARVRAGTTANTLVVGGAHDDNTWRLWCLPGVDGDFVRTLRATNQDDRAHGADYARSGLCLRPPTKYPLQPPLSAAEVVGLPIAGGTVGVYWNGTLLKQVDLRSVATNDQQVLPVGSFPSVSNGTIVVKTMNTGRVLVDGLAISRQ